MPRCNSRRCGFLGVCVGSPSDCYCATRLTPKKVEKKMKELDITDIRLLWDLLKGRSNTH